MTPAPGDMPVAIPTHEPSRVTAGETLAWTRTLPDTPASLYQLKYSLQAPGQAFILITGSASGDTHTVNVASGVSIGWAPARYILTPYVELLADAAVRHILLHEVRELPVLPRVDQALPETESERKLRLISLALDGRIPNGLESSDIDGQQLSLIPLTQLERLKMIYMARVASEAALARRSAGLPSRRRILGRFTAECGGRGYPRR